MVNGQLSHNMPHQFQVPQFIEHESKLVGPFTLKQTALFGGGGALLFVLWFMLEKWLFFLLAFPILLIFILIGFMKVNGRPLLDFVGSFFNFFISPQLYIWQKRLEAQEKIKKSKKEKVERFEGPSSEVTKQGIKDLAKKLDTYG